LELDGGRVVSVKPELGLIRIEFRPPKAVQSVNLPVPFPHLTSVKIVEGFHSAPLAWQFNQDASRLSLEASSSGGGAMASSLLLEMAEKTTQFPDGRIVFSALDAVVEGSQARLETHPGNHRIGFWTRLEDSVVWNYKPTRWGRYDVEYAFSADGGDGTELEFELAGHKLRAKRPATGSWYRYTTMSVGRVYLAKSDPFQLRVRGLNKPGVAVMNLKAVTLRPAPEGNPIRQSSNGEILLHSRDAITHSVLMRYEPQTNKNCLGYWANPKDRAQWRFQVDRGGEFDVEIWQGCGKGHGGSDVEVRSGDQALRFVVEDTGHFQNWKARSLGRIKLGVGERDLWVNPLRKPGGAVMDIHQIILKPISP